MLNSDVDLIADARLEAEEVRLAREPWIRQRRNQPRSWRATSRRILVALGIVALRPAELDPLPASLRAYAHLTS